MNKAKHFIIVVLVLGMFYITFAEKRAKPMPLEELTNPDSPSYVPYPYPKTRKEIIEDLKYAIKKLFEIKDGEKEVFVGNHRPLIKEILPPQKNLWVVFGRRSLAMTYTDLANIFSKIFNYNSLTLDAGYANVSQEVSDDQKIDI